MPSMSIVSACGICDGYFEKTTTQRETINWSGSKTRKYEHNFVVFKRSDKCTVGRMACIEHVQVCERDKELKENAGCVRASIDANCIEHTKKKKRAPSCFSHLGTRSKTCISAGKYWREEIIFKQCCTSGCAVVL